MSDPSTGRPENAAAQAARELAELQAQITNARAQLARLLQDVAEAEDHLGRKRMPTALVEANERLVLAALGAHAHAETATRELEEVSRTAELDALTGLPNRVLLLDRFEHAIATAKRHGNRLALLFLDLDNFKQLNDSRGHAFGDEVLKLAAQCLASSVRGEDTVSRHGGDEFVILLDEVAHPSDAILVADKVRAALDGPHQLGDEEVRLAASIGISIYPDHGEDPDTLIERADAAMYYAKRQGLGSFAFHGEEPAGATGVDTQPRETAQQTRDRHHLALAEYERQHAQLREANEQLVLAGLGAQELQASAEQAQQRQTEFLATLAHEMRNPLAPIRTAAALLSQSGTDQTLLPRLQAVIERQVVHLSRLVSDLLDVSRASTGKLRLERQVVDLADVIDEAVDACRPAMDVRLQRLTVEVPSSRGLEVDGDPVRLVQVLSNLLDNASKYTPGGGTIGLSVKQADDSVVMTVSDNGIGIAAEALPGVFEPFVQDPHAIGFDGVGLGIGLAVVRELVKAHGGTVVATSAGSGRGSQFVVTLPLAGRG